MCSALLALDDGMFIFNFDSRSAWYQMRRLIPVLKGRPRITPLAALHNPPPTTRPCPQRLPRFPTPRYDTAVRYSATSSPVPRYPHGGVDATDADTARFELCRPTSPSPTTRTSVQLRPRQAPPKQVLGPPILSRPTNRVARLHGRAFA